MGRPLESASSHRGAGFLIGGHAQRIDRDEHHTVSASEMFSHPAVMVAPGNPTTPTSQKPLTRTPTAARRLFVKYNIAGLRPGRTGELEVSSCNGGLGGRRMNH
jgi:hypothetical protein